LFIDATDHLYWITDVNIGENEILKRDGFIVFIVDDVRSMGIQLIVQSVLSRLPADAPIHLSIDIDGLDPEYASSTGTSVKGALYLEDALHITRTLGETGRLVALDLVEVNPDETLSDSPQLDRMTTIASTCALIQSAIQFSSLSKRV
jgi:arginase